MDYKTHYINLITSRFNRVLDPNVYYERHHIIPKCLGGSNKKENLVYLTAREHYIAHWLLYRIRPHSNGVSFAFWKMSFGGGKFLKNRQYRISSTAYSEAKQAMASANRRLNTGRKVKPAHLVKWTRNKNNSKRIINTKTQEIYSNAKQLWRDKFQSDITYSAFNYYLRGLIKGNVGRGGGPRKIFNNKIYDWKYMESTND